MSTSAWIAFYVVNAMWWLWIARWGGARSILGGWASWLLHPVAWRWDAEVIALFAWLSLGASTVWFVIGVFEPEMRVDLP